MLDLPELDVPLRKTISPCDARHTLAYARHAHAERGRLSDCAGAIATAACQSAHAVLAARGQWVTNEKTLLDRAGLRDIDGLLGGLAPGPRTLTAAIDAATVLLGSAVNSACSAQTSS